MHQEPPSQSMSTGPSSDIDPPHVQAEQAVGLPAVAEGRPKRISKAPPCGTGGHKHGHKAGPEASDEGHARPPPYYTRQRSGGYEYLKEPLWWIGMITMIVGELANVVAYMFAPAVLVTPLGALSITVSAVLAHFFLKEKLQKMGILGCGLCIVGSTLIVLHAPGESSLTSVEEIWEFATQPDSMTQLSLKRLGLSDAFLATLASEATGQIDDVSEHRKHLDFGQHDEKFKSIDVQKPLIKVSNDDYESLPSYLKGLEPWEDLLDAIEKINSSLIKKVKINGCNYFHQDEISSLGLGHKARSYLLLLVRLNRLVVETIDG
ncbi:hypothetical protein SO802_031503 [Lithocarpus litseifolius]|uniref:Probable magnesium transporter n=1 Tax=Lithocarpus litseifolius TaxID=425828 RepID=A0AAW2BN32_9ROSI